MRSRRGAGADLYTLAEELNNLGDHERALPLAERAVSEDPQAWRNWCNLARALNGLFRHAEALRATERALALEPQAEWAYRQRAVALGGLGRRSEALAAVRESVRISPNESRTWAHLANVAAQLGYESEARQAAERAVALNPTFAGHWVTLSFVCLEVDWDEAQRACERALQLEPDNRMALNNLGWVLLTRGAAQEARDLFDRAIRIAPGQTKWLYNRALATGLLEGREAGTAEYRRASELGLAHAERRIADNPRNAVAHAHRATLLRHLGTDPNVVLESMRRAVALDPHLAAGWGGLTETAAAAGRWQLARYSARRAIAADPSTPGRWTNAAEVAFHAGRPAEAASWANRVVAEAPDSRAYLEAKRLLHDINGEVEEALAVAREDLSLSPLSCCRNVAVAACHIALKDEQSAHEALEQAELSRPGCGCFRRQRVQRLLGNA
ncbi:MAG TPA: tetratricopeptide repeat protein [Gaiellaceae bacterium]|nr:tetratricopeptide repeat protein [Gaiellaceae bacterium]